MCMEDSRGGSLFKSMAQASRAGILCFKLGQLCGVHLFRHAVVKARLNDNDGNFRFGVGPDCSGSDRFQRMLTAAESGAIVPPADTRFLKLGVRRREEDNPVVAKIISFLENLYQSVAETLPDMRAAPDCETTLVDGATVTVEGDYDPYAEVLNAEQQATIKPRKKPRAFKSLALDPALEVEKEVRWLPPGGHMKDYWEQMCLTDGKVSFSQF